MLTFMLTFMCWFLQSDDEKKYIDLMSVYCPPMLIFMPPKHIASGAFVGPFIRPSIMLFDS